MRINFVESVPYVPPDFALREPQHRLGRALIRASIDPDNPGLFGRFVLDLIDKEERMDGENTPNQPLQGPIEPPKGLTEGRNCHYVMPKNRHCAAIITRVHDRRTGTVDLAVFDEESRDTHYIPGITYDPLNMIRGTWHYIEPVE